MILFCSGVSGKFLKAQDSHGRNKISDFVQKLMIEINRHDTATKDVVLLAYADNYRYRNDLIDTAELIVKVLPKENIVTFPNIDVAAKNERMRKAAVIIIISDATSGVNNF